ncbi:hypothetical protein V5799_005560, partial [Amblyomma americanum]
MVHSESAGDMMKIPVLSGRADDVDAGCRTSTGLRPDNTWCFSPFYEGDIKSSTKEEPFHVQKQ